MKTVALLLACLVPQDPAPPAGPAREEILRRDVEEAIRRLGSDRRAVSYEAWGELVEIGRPAIPGIVAELNRKETPPAVRRALCEILGRIRAPHPEAVAALTARLRDSEEFGTTVAAAAARALAEIGDEKSAGALLEVLRSKEVESDRHLKIECIRALGLMRIVEGVEPLRKALGDRRSAPLGEEDDQAPLIAAAAADALGLLRAAAAVDDLGKLLEESQVNAATEMSLGLHAARALRRILDPELRGKDEKVEPRAAPFLGDRAADEKVLEAWKKWWGERKDRRDVEETRSLVGKVAAAVEAFKKEQGRYPEVLAYLQKPPTYARNFPKEGYYAGELKDAWGRPLVYQHPGTGADFDVVSLGKDGKRWGGGVNADLWNHDRWVAAKQAETRRSLEETVQAIRKFKEEQGTYPRQIRDLVTKPDYVTRWPEKGYLPALPKDGFDAYLVYNPVGTGGEPFDLLSYGADGAEGGTGADEDLWNHDKRPPKKEEPKKDEKKDEKK